jgi:hypothetical protein|tara:strand:- start:150 stop:374 length:225 start_codon:yes stop_codon:yes gene_type:complete
MSLIPQNHIEESRKTQIDNPKKYTDRDSHGDHHQGESHRFLSSGPGDPSDLPDYLTEYPKTNRSTSRLRANSAW